MSAHDNARMDAVPYVAKILREVARGLGVDVRELRLHDAVESVVLELLQHERAAAAQQLGELERRLTARPLGERVTEPAALPSGVVPKREPAPFDDEPTVRYPRAGSSTRVRTPR